MNTKKPLPTLVVFAILTTVTVFVWIGFDAYRAFTKKPSPSVDPAIIEQLDSTLDAETLTSLTQRIHLEDSEIGETQLLNLDVSQTAETPSEEQPLTETPENTELETPESTEEGEPI